MSDKKEQKLKGPIIGIDLGTTYSCVGIFKNNTVDIIANDQGNRTLPSYVAFTDTERLVGESAKGQSSTNPQNTVFDVKRLIGRKFSDPSVQSDIKHFPFKVKADKDDKPVIVVQFMGEEKTFTPEQISAMILEKLKSIAESYLGEPVKHAVVTVPAYFNDSQRQATKDAGTIAGLNVVRIINEPTAASFAYGLNKNHQERNVLIFDLGGGTFDVSVLEIDKETFIVKSTSGDTHCGGEDFDNSIVTHCIEDFSKKQKLKIDQLKELQNNKRAIRRLRTACETAKKTLSSSTTTTISVDAFYDGRDLNVPLTRAKFENLCEKDFKRCMGPLETAIKESKLSKSDIHDIVLVGGSTRIPRIREMLKEYFNGKEPKSEVNPDEAVAFGAAVQGAILSDNDDVRGIVLIDVTPLSLGIETSGGIMTAIIDKNSTIPTSKGNVFSTYADNQPAVTIKVYEGERALTKDNRLLGTFDLGGIPPMPRGVPKIKVSFDLDANGILNVTATEESTGTKKNCTIKNERGRLSKEEIEKMLREETMYAEQDKMIREKIEAKNSLEVYLYGVKTSLTDKLKETLGVDDTKKITETVDDGLKWLELHSEAEKEEIDSKHKEVEGIVMPLLTQAYQKGSPNTDGSSPSSEPTPDTEPAGGNGGPKIDEVD